MWPIQLTRQSEQTFKLYDLFKSNQWVTSRINLSSGGNYYMHLREIGRLANQLPHWVLTFDPPGEGPFCFQLTVLIFFTCSWPPCDPGLCNTLCFTVHHRTLTLLRLRGVFPSSLQQKENLNTTKETQIKFFWSNINKNIKA